MTKLKNIFVLFQITSLLEFTREEEPSARPMPAWEKIPETMVEMDSTEFLVAGGKPEVERENFLWKFGQANGQYRCILGHNTMFKVSLQKYFFRA